MKPLLKKLLTATLLATLLLLTYLVLVLIPNARQAAHRAQTRGSLFFLAFLSRNFTEARNLPPSEFRSSRKFGDKSLNWRVYTHLEMDRDSGLSTQEIDDRNASGKYNLPESAPTIFQIPIDQSDPTWTDILALTADPEDNGKSPIILAFVAVPNSGIRWTEMKDLTWFEFALMIAQRTDDSPPLTLMTTDAKYATITGRNQLTFDLSSHGANDRGWTTNDLQKLFTPSNPDLK